MDYFSFLDGQALVLAEAEKDSRRNRFIKIIFVCRKRERDEKLSISMRSVRPIKFFPNTS